MCRYSAVVVEYIELVHSNALMVVNPLSEVLCLILDRQADGQVCTLGSAVLAADTVSGIVCG